MGNYKLSRGFFYYFQAVNLKGQAGTMGFPRLLSHIFERLILYHRELPSFSHRPCLQTMEARVCFYWNSFLAGWGYLVSFKMWEIPLMSQCRLKPWRHFVSLIMTATSQLFELTVLLPCLTCFTYQTLNHKSKNNTPFYFKLFVF